MLVEVDVIRGEPRCKSSFSSGLRAKLTIMNIGSHHRRVWRRVPSALGSVFGWSRRGRSDFKVALKLADAIIMGTDLGVVLLVVDLEAFDVRLVVLVALTVEFIILSDECVYCS